MYGSVSHDKFGLLSLKLLSVVLMTVMCEAVFSDACSLVVCVCVCS